MKKIDEDGLLDSVELLPKQIEHAWAETKALSLPFSDRATTDITVCGMGGSALGADVVRSLYGQRLQRPFHIVNDYRLPGYIGKQSLVILSSYSGNTEEILSCAQSAIKKKARIVAITAGGKLEALAKKNKWPRYLIEAKYNPCNQPRMALGYAVFGLIGLLKASKHLNIADKDVKLLIKQLTGGMRQFSVEQVENNPAKQIAMAAKQKMLFFVAADHMLGAAHVVNNQINENAKHLSTYLPIPEMDHHFLEALKAPAIVKKHLLFVLFQSSFYGERIQKRIRLTADLLAENGILTRIVNSSASSPLQQVWEGIHMGSFASFYLAMLHGVNPAPVPNVESFKQRLKK